MGFKRALGDVADYMLCVWSVLLVDINRALTKQTVGGNVGHAPSVEGNGWSSLGQDPASGLLT